MRRLFFKLSGVVLLMLSSSVRAETAEKPLSSKIYSVWFRTNGGLYSIVNDADLASAANGFGVSLASGLSFSTRSLQLSGGLGWAYSSIGVSPSAHYLADTANISNTVPDNLSTNYGYGDFAFDYRLDSSLLLGANLMLPFGVDTQFTIREDQENTLTHPFVGVEMKFTPSRIFTPASPSWWYGVNVMRDLLITDRDVYMVLASVSYDLPVFYSEARPIVVYKDRYKMREKVLTTLKDRHFISLGIINFAPQQESLPSGDSYYLNSLAQLLASRSPEWQAVMIGSNNRAFDESTQALTKKRLEAIRDMLVQNGISAVKIKNYDLVKQDSQTSVFDSVDAIDISVVGDRDVVGLKNDIMHLMQRFAIPDTCSAGKCI